MRYKCFFCGGSFKSPMKRLLHIQERGSRCSIAGGAFLIEVRNSGYPIGIREKLKKHKE